jgi:hypothetical protein
MQALSGVHSTTAPHTGRTYHADRWVQDGRVALLRNPSHGCRKHHGAIATPRHVIHVLPQARGDRHTSITHSHLRTWNPSTIDTRFLDARNKSTWNRSCNLAVIRYTTRWLQKKKSWSNVAYTNTMRQTTLNNCVSRRRRLLVFGAHFGCSCHHRFPCTRHSWLTIPTRRSRLCFGFVQPPP